MSATAVYDSPPLSAALTFRTVGSHSERMPAPVGSLWFSCAPAPAVMPLPARPVEPAMEMEEEAERWDGLS